MPTSFIGKTDLSRAIRNNNPGNIRPNKKIKWVGEIGQEGGYIIFIDIEHGIRAMAIDLKNKINRGLNTLAKYIPVYAPAADNNNTQVYIDRVVKLTGIASSTILGADNNTLFKLIKAHINVEAGNKNAQLITDDMISAGIALAV